MNIAEATLAPRIHHQWLPDQLSLEEGFSPDTIDLLRRKGRAVSVRRPRSTVQTARRMATGVRGVADPRPAGGPATGPVALEPRRAIGGASLRERVCEDE